MTAGRKIIKIASKIFLALIGLFIVVFASVWLILKVPAVQNFLVSKITTYVSNKTHTQVELKYIDLEFPKSILLQGIFFEDLNHDTLVSVQELEVNINMLALFSKTVSIETLGLNNFYIQLNRNNSDSTFNYQFLLEAFTSDTNTEEKIDTSEATPWTIKANGIALTHGRFDMDDAIGGLKMSLSIGNLEAELNKLDLDKSIADLGDINLSEIHGTIRNSKSSAVDATSNSESWKGIELAQLTIQRSSLNYSDATTDLLVAVIIGKLELESSTFDLHKQNIISESLSIDQSSGIVHLNTSDTSNTSNTNKPDWNVQVQTFDIKKSAFKLNILNEEKLKKGIDWNHLALTSINTSIHNIIYNGPVIQATIESLSVQDKSGFGIRSLTTKAYMDTNKASLTGLNLITNHSQFGQNIQIGYTSLKEIASSLSFECSMQNNHVAVKDLLLLLPDLDTIEIIHKNKDRSATFNLIAKGNVNQLNIKQFSIKTLESSIDTKGQLRFITDPDKIYIDLAFKQIQTGAADLFAILPDSTLPNSLQIPSEINLKGNYKGTLSNFQSNIDLNSSIGSAIIQANMKDVQKEIPSYAIAIQTHSFNLGKLINQSTFGVLNGSADIKGSGFKLSNTTATIHTEIKSISINTYNYHNINLDGAIEKGLIDAKGEVLDSNLKLTLVSKVNLNKEQEFYDLKLDIKGADLQGLGITEKHITLSANTDLHLIGDPTKNINGHISSRNILVIQDGKRYKEDSLILVSMNEPGKSNVKLNSSMFVASFDGNIDIFSIRDALTNHFNRYFLLTEKKYLKSNPQNFTFAIKLNKSPLLREVVLPSLSNYSPMSINGSFNSEEAKLYVNATIPMATYDGISVSKFIFSIDSDPSKLNYNTGWSYLKTENITIQQTQLNGAIQRDSASILLNIKNEKGENKIQLNSFVTRASKDHFRFSIFKNGLILQEKQWNVSDKNYIEIASHYFFADQFKLSNGNQYIQLQSSNKGNDMELKFNEFNLHTLSQIIEDQDTLMVQGVLDGNIKLENFQQNPAFTSMLNIKDLTYKNSRVGNLTIQADNLTSDRYTASLELKDSTNKVRISGYYLSSDEKSSLHFDANIESIELHSLESFSDEQIQGSTGIVKGNIAITGALKKPIFNGDLTFIDASTKVAFLNQRLFMKEETIRINPEKITFNSFNIKDSLNNEAIINGSVGIKEFDNVTFNLNVTTNDFMVLNTTAKNNSLYYGKVILDSKISIKGNNTLPIIKADINIVKGSHFTFAVPESKVSIDRGDGIVIFTSDSSSLDPIMLRENEEIISQTITGIDLSAKIQVDQNSTFKLLVDPVSGDSLSVKGNADLNFKMDETGQMNLTGIYTVSEGTYKASLENLIIRKFNITRGSRIVWSGDPYNALVDIKATYTTKTAPDGLLANTAVIDSSALRKPLPFIIIMSMEGELLKPSISFQLDMPDNVKGAVGGEVYSKITSINANESEVNKQVFALLVLNRFITPDNSSGSGASDFARRSVSRMMSNELNKLSDQYVEGLQIDVDVQSYNSVNNGQQQGNTQVEVGVTKSLLDERLTVQIGGNVPIEGQDAAKSNAKNITGDAIIEYKLTKNGRYKVKAFRTNQYDGISNGTIVETGAGVMYVRNFTHFKELFISEKKRKKLREEKVQE